MIMAVLVYATSVFVLFESIRTPVYNTARAFAKSGVEFLIGMLSYTQCKLNVFNENDSRGETRITSAQFRVYSADDEAYTTYDMKHEFLQLVDLCGGQAACDGRTLIRLMHRDIINDSDGDAYGSDHDGDSESSDSDEDGAVDADDNDAETEVEDSVAESAEQKGRETQTTVDDDYIESNESTDDEGGGENVDNSDSDGGEPPVYSLHIQYEQGQSEHEIFYHANDARGMQVLFPPYRDPVHPRRMQGCGTRVMHAIWNGVDVTEKVKRLAGPRHDFYSGITTIPAACIFISPTPCKPCLEPSHTKADEIKMMDNKGRMHRVSPVRWGGPSLGFTSPPP